MVSRDVILRIEESKAVVDGWQGRHRSEACQVIQLDFTRADVLERWEAIMRDPEFPDRQVHISHLNRILNLADSGKLTLRQT